MEAFRRIPALGTPCRHRGSAFGTRTLHDQGQSAAWRETDAASPPRGCIYTVISGVFYIGLGDEFDADKLEAYSPGAAIILPGHTSHFHWAKSGEYVTQVTAIGPLGMEYVNSNDDPRTRKSGV